MLTLSLARFFLVILFVGAYGATLQLLYEGYLKKEDKKAKEIVLFIFMMLLFLGFYGLSGWFLWESITGLSSRH